MKTRLRLATRQSALALWQAEHVKQRLLAQHPDLDIVLTPLSTRGDDNKTVPLTALGGKTTFVKRLQTALLDDDADFAVHCVKDMSVFPVDGLCVAAVDQRADARDAFLSSQYASLDALPAGAIVGTSSPRRQSLILHERPDLVVQPIRGNVPTRIEKMEAGNYDATILAAAGLARLGLTDKINAYFDPTRFVPAIGQGALAIECRDADADLKALLNALNHTNTARCIDAEQQVNQILQADCHSAVGVYATTDDTDHTITVQAVVGSPDGKQLLHAKATGDVAASATLAKQVATALLDQGAQTLLAPNI